MPELEMLEQLLPKRRKNMRKVFRALKTNFGVIVLKRDLIRQTWRDCYNRDINLVLEIALLRGFLGKHPELNLKITTVRGYGYILESKEK